MCEKKVLSHVDSEGRAQMVNVGNKPIQRRRARAEGRISVSKQTIRQITENQIKKGDVLTVAQIAGIQAAKQTALLIPLCHPLGIDQVNVQLTVQEDSILATAEAFCLGRTGIEMEVLTAVSVALLTVYDMCKAVDKEMKIEGIHLLEKVKEDV